MEAPREAENPFRGDKLGREKDYTLEEGLVVSGPNTKGQRKNERQGP